MSKLFSIFIIVFSAWLHAGAQYNWKLSSNNDGVSIYTSLVQDSKVKAVKVNCTFNASVSQLVALILDIKATPDWVYHTKSCTLVKQVSPSELYYHSEIELPWPLKNRDFVAHLIVSQHPVSKVVTIDGPSVSGFIPVYPDVVRISNSKGRWIITPISSGRIEVEYILYTDPGGNLPAWLINLFATEGPEHIFKKLKIQLLKPVYKNVRLGFISN